MGKGETPGYFGQRQQTKQRNAERQQKDKKEASTLQWKPLYIEETRYLLFVVIYDDRRIFAKIILFGEFALAINENMFNAF